MRHTCRRHAARFTVPFSGPFSAGAPAQGRDLSRRAVPLLLGDLFQRYACTLGALWPVRRPAAGAIPLLYIVSVAGPPPGPARPLLPARLRPRRRRARRHWLPRRGRLCGALDLPGPACRVTPRRASLRTELCGTGPLRCSVVMCSEHHGRSVVRGVQDGWSPPLPPLPRTNWTRLVPPPVLTGHVRRYERTHQRRLLVPRTVLLVLLVLPVDLLTRRRRVRLVRGEGRGVSD